MGPPAWACRFERPIDKAGAVRCAPTAAATEALSKRCAVLPAFSMRFGVRSLLLLTDRQLTVAVELPSHLSTPLIQVGLD